jgi:hypothetical protein
MLRCGFPGVQQHSNQGRNGLFQRPRAWIASAKRRAIVAAVERRVRDGSFGRAFPEVCNDYGYPIGTDSGLFSHALQGVVPKISWPLNDNEIPDHHAAFDLTQFCYATVASPQQVGWHEYPYSCCSATSTVAIPR